jgi:hypothetical protein
MITNGQSEKNIIICMFLTLKGSCPFRKGLEEALSPVLPYIMLSATLWIAKL